MRGRSWVLNPPRNARERRRAKNSRLVCYCLGLWFPHRMGSRASAEFARQYGTAGCEGAA